MFVKCNIKIARGMKIEFILNLRHFVVFEKLDDECSLSLHFATGDFIWHFDYEEKRDEVYSAFEKLLSTKENIISDNLSLLIL